MYNCRHWVLGVGAILGEVGVELRNHYCDEMAGASHVELAVGRREETDASALFTINLLPPMQ